MIRRISSNHSSFASCPRSHPFDDWLQVWRIDSSKVTWKLTGNSRPAISSEHKSSEASSGATGMPRPSLSTIADHVLVPKCCLGYASALHQRIMTRG